jgi:hypothetical protein
MGKHSQGSEIVHTESFNHGMGKSGGGFVLRFG